MKHKIYLVDDDKNIRLSIKEILEEEGYEVQVFSSGKACLKQLEKERPSVVFLDVWLNKEDGIEVLKEIRKLYSSLPVIMISGHATIELAVQATKIGAVDFLEKPLSIGAILEKLDQVLQVKTTPLKEIKLEHDEIIGTSEQILKVKQAIAQAAKTNARVFIYGENGTGKELVAKMIYKNSDRKDKPFVDINCAAIPEELIESELFGHEKGAFTGAFERRIGKFEQANGGTLFLDEICDMSLAMQAKVLRVIEEQQLTRIGGTEKISIDVRIIAATNIDPLQAIKEGKFREDLYYRLNVIPIVLPPLRDRVSDIPLLLDFFLKKTIEAHKLPPKVFTNSAIELLTQYSWPGNVRELKNIVERLAILSEENEIDIDDVQNSLFNFIQDKDEDFPGLDLKSARREFERNYIIKALKQFEKNISKTAKFLGMERTHLHKKIKSLNIKIEDI
ncbi:MAG: sigma-54 dependent transcriptional regulator [Leptospiraceae bacterium]|nr:sigma-54 dependent transcriptional regulator [Leptospiraceae bacterium]MDW7976098.1 sigma-54 dependent transcriptional regulator [Leptospiraceae bacterium]